METIKEKKELSPFDKLYQTNVNAHTEKKYNGTKYLTYLSWAWAWAELKKIYPEAKYEIKMFEDEKGLKRPYIYDQILGYMVMTSITAGGQTYEMWLPVMDSANKSMKADPYTYTVKVKDKRGSETFVEKTVPSATMWEVNRTIMRCLVKNMAMFGLGLYIYAGEDLPEDLDIEEQPQVQQQETKAPQSKVVPVADQLKKRQANVIASMQKYKDQAITLEKYMEIKNYVESFIKEVDEVNQQLLLNTFNECILPPAQEVA